MKEGAKDDEDGGEDEGDTKVVAGEGPDERVCWAWAHAEVVGRQVFSEQTVL